MIHKNINSFKNIIYILATLAFITQLLLSENSIDIFCVLLIYLSLTLTVQYCFGEDNFFNYPISSLIIFTSFIINIGGALFLKSFELSIVTEKLQLPLSTIGKLCIFNFIIILSHLIYRNIFIAKVLNNKLQKFFGNLIFIKQNETNFLVFSAYVAIMFRFFYMDFDLPFISQFSKGAIGAGLFQDISNLFNFLFFLPIVIIFSNKINNWKVGKSEKFLFVIYIFFVIIISLMRNSRSTLFDFFALSFIFIFLTFLFDKIKIKSYSFFIKCFLFLALLVPLYNTFEKLSYTFISSRADFHIRSPVENLNFFIENLKTLNINEIKESREMNFYERRFEENYYKSTLFNRMNIILINDQVNYFNRILSVREKDSIRSLVKGKIISILPQPIIEIFSQDFQKWKYVETSTQSTILGIVDYMYGNKNIGSSIMMFNLIFGFYSYFLLLFIFIPFFLIFDAFFNKKNKTFSPFILIFFYTTSMGLLNLFSSTEISVWIALTFRKIPETLFIVFILRIIYINFLKRKS